MSNTTDKNAALSKLVEEVDQNSWQGCTLEELQKRRVIALVKRELGREKLKSDLAQMKDKMSTNGVRGMLFSNSDLPKLKKADFLFLGWKLIKGIIKFRNRKRNRN